MKMVKYIFALATCVLSTTSCENTFKNVLKNNNHIINNPINDKVTVTFDANGGVLTGKSEVTVESGTTFGSITKPTATLETVSSCGWYQTTPGSYIQDTDPINSSITLKADWKKYTVVFSSGEGKFSDGTKSKTLDNKVIVHGEDVGIPLAPVDKAFEGWEINSSNEYISFPYKPSGDVSTINITAKYKTVSTVNVVLMAREGSFEGGKKSISTRVDKDTTLKQAIEKGWLEYPTITGDYIFGKYQLNGVDVDEDYKFTTSTLLSARYDSAISVTFNAGDGAYDDSSKSKKTELVKYNKDLKLSDFKAKITENPTLKVDSTSYDVQGWASDGANANSPISLNDTLETLKKTGSFTVYAYYKNPHAITFAGSGFNAPEDKSFIRNDTKDFVITPQPGYTLTVDGVAVSYDNTTYTNTEITKNKETNGNITIKVKNAPGSDISVTVTPTANVYTVTDLTSDTEKAKFKTLSIPSSATYNTSITVTSTGNDGYKPNKITITHTGGTTDVNFTYDEISSSYKATFTMSYAENISIAAYATAIDYSVTQGTHTTGVVTDSVKFKNGSSGSEVTSISDAHIGDTIIVKASNETGYTLKKIKVTYGTSEITADFASGQASFTMPAASVTVQVIAEINKYTLTLDGNGGTPDVSKIDNVNYGSNLSTTLGSYKATLTDAQFKGWGENSESQTILSGSETMPDSNKTVYAIWNKYKFIFQVPTTDPHGSVSGTTEYGPQITLSKSEISGLTVIPNTGYSFTGTYKVTGAGVAAGITTNFSNPLKPGAFDTPIKTDAEIYLEPVFEAIKYDVSFTYGPNEHLSSDTPIEVPYGTKLLDTSKVTLPTATHDFAKFNSWYDDSGNKITDTTTMPAKAITLHPTWDTYTIDIVVDNGTSSKTQFNDVLEVHSDEFTITPSEGYEFNNKYQYSTDGGSTYKDLASMPFRPYALDTTITSSSSIKLKAICESKPAETVDVVLFADGGSFTSGDQKTVNVIKGKKWSEIGDISSWSSDLTPPSTKKFDHWSLTSGGDVVPDATTFNDDMLLFAVYVDA